MLYPVTQIPAPNHYRGRRGHVPRYIVLHYSVGSGRPHGTARFFASHPRRQASYHFEIARDATQTQLVDTDDGAWHAKGIPLGRDRRVARVVNLESIGIVLGNWGHMTEAQAERRGVTDMIVSGHPAFGNPRKLRLWQRYTEPQYQSLAFLIHVLRRDHPTIEALTGHEDHEAGKSDPGPAFDWARVCRETGLPYMHRDRRTGEWSALHC